MARLVINTEGFIKRLNGSPKRAFVHEVRRMADPYVPFKEGTLKNTATESNKSIVYDQPYARRQYYEHKGKGLRGARWVMRMWKSRGAEILSAFQNRLNGR